ncbi:MAG TPA: enoyl-CoA hydratase/isomerase family protein [Candidatus Limnocylindrales bacterium]
MGTGSSLSVETVNGVAVVRLTHGKVNALDIELCRAISETFHDLTGSAGAVVFTGTGPAFSAGVDLWRVLDGGPDYVDAFLPALVDAFLPALVDAFAAVFTCELPVVAAVNGHAIAGGCILAAACDHRVMAAGGGGIGIPEMLVGVPFPATALAIVEHAAGAKQARKLVYSGELLRPEAALESGLVDRLAAPEELVELALEQASRLASSIPPGTFAATKRYLNRLPCPSEYDGEVVRLWRERVADGWIAGYMARTVRRSPT